MAEQIITLGIGPIANLTPFITTGLDIGAAVIDTGRGFSIFLPYQDTRAVSPLKERRAFVGYREKRTVTREG